jgi:TonB family protein
MRLLSPNILDIRFFFPLNHMLGLMNRPYGILPPFCAVIPLRVFGFNALARPYSDAERKATFIRMVQPEYALDARRSGREGTGLFRHYIDERGKITGVAVLQSTGDKALDFESLRALWQWRARKGAPRDVDVPLRFTLRGGSHSGDNGMGHDGLGIMKSRDR